MTSDEWLNHSGVLMEVLDPVWKRMMVRTSTIILPVLLLAAPVLMAQTLQEVTINGTYQTSTGTITLNQPGNPTGSSVVFINPCDSTTTPTSYDGQNCDWPPTDETDFPMPALSFIVSSPYNTAAYTVEWSVSEEYTDDHGVTNTYHQNPPSLRGDQPWRISWVDESVGGGAIVTADVYEQCNPPVEVAKGSLSFFIFGVNQNQAQTDMEENVVNASVLGNAAWFLPNLIALESGGHQFGEASGHPYFGEPDGNGVMQVDRTKQPGYYTTQNAYWNFVDNMRDGAQILSQVQSSMTCDPDDTSNSCMNYAYDFWDRQVKQACEAAGGTYTPGGSPGNGSCSVSTQSAPPSVWLHCAFGYPQSASYPNPYKDAEWITAYNGTCNGYFISWNLSTNSWQINYPSSNSLCPESNFNYVAAVCSKQGY